MIAGSLVRGFHKASPQHASAHDGALNSPQVRLYVATTKPGAAAEASADEVLLERLQRDLDGYGPSLHQVVTTSDCLPDCLSGRLSWHHFEHHPTDEPQLTPSSSAPNPN